MKLSKSMQELNPHLAEGGKKPKKPISVPKPMPPQFCAIVNHLKIMGFTEVEKIDLFPGKVFRNRIFSKEYRFSDRDWRFDAAFYVNQKCYFIEYEGLVWGGTGGHQTPEGYTENLEKYNAAAMAGWIGLSYSCLNYKDFIKDLKKILS